MRSEPAIHRRLVVLTVAFLVGATAGPALAWHYAKNGWRDKHYNYPPKPYGYSQIVATFGQPCNDRTYANSMMLRAADNGVYYTVRFHKRLGGTTSSNLDNDVKGHIYNNHLGEYVKSGIWGRECRYIAGTTKWSTHAWGIAVDVSASYEPVGAGCGSSTTNYHHAPIWRNHRWTWLECYDPMHFQYASGY